MAVELITIEKLFSKFGQIIGYECNVDDISAIADAFTVHLSNAGMKLSYIDKIPFSFPRPLPSPSPSHYQELDAETEYVNTKTLSEQWSDCSDVTKLWWKDCANHIDCVGGKRMTGWNAFTMMKGSKERVAKLTRDDGSIARPLIK